MPGPYAFKQIFAADPSNTSNVAKGGSVLLFAVGDATRKPLVLTDLANGMVLPNPVPVNSNGFGPAFMHETLPQVAWEGGGFSGTFESYEGLRADAVAAMEASQESAQAAGDALQLTKVAADNAAAGAAGALAGAVAEATAAKAAAQAAAGLVGAPAGAAVLAAIQPGGAAHGALSGTIGDLAGDLIEESLVASPSFEDARGGNWNYPAAQYVDKPSPRTYFGASSEDGGILACYFDHSTRVKKVVKVGQVLPVDGHNCGTVDVSPGARTLVGWTAHSAENFIRVRTSDPSGDITTFGPEQRINAGGPVTYVQWRRDHDNPNAGWVFFRLMLTVNPTQFRWAVARWRMDANGVITQDAPKIIFTYDNNVQFYMLTGKKNDNELHVAISGHPFNGGFTSMHYAVINTTTGAVTSPDTAVSGNIVTGVGLPIHANTLKNVFTPVAGRSAAIHDIQGGGEATGIAFSTTNSAGAWEYFHLPKRHSASPGLRITQAGGGHYATTPGSGMDTTTLKFRMLIKPDVLYIPGKQQRFASRWEPTVNGGRCWMLGLGESNRQLAFLTSSDGMSGTVKTHLSGLVSESALGFGVDYNPAGGTIAFFQTLDGSTWEQVGATATFAPTAIHQNAETPLRVGGITATATFYPGAVGTLQRFTQYAGVDSSTVIADFNPVDPKQWDAGDSDGAAKVDPTGRTWNLVGQVFVSTDGWANPVSLGLSGGGFGGVAAGMLYPNPGRGDVAYGIVKAGSQWQMKRWARGHARGAWDVSIVATYDGLSMAAPRSVKDAGPFEGFFMVTNNFNAQADAYAGTSRFA